MAPTPVRLLVISMTLALSIAPSTTTFAYEIPSSRKPKLSGDTDTLQKISKAVATIADHAKKGIVFVSVSKVVKGQQYGLVNPFDFFFGPGPGRRGEPQSPPEFKQKGLGSGFFIDLDKGYILTNNHVIEGADEISLKLANGETYDGKVVGRDKNTDVAVVQIKGKFDRSGINQLSLGNSNDVAVGDFCVAAGAPFGLQSSISFGVVSALGRGNMSITSLGNFIQTDAAINPGNSGGPLLSSDGQVIGINTAIFSKSGGYNGIGFAIPSDLVRKVANQLINKGKVDRGYLGVMLSEMDPELAKEMDIPKGYHGALVRSVESGTPADKGGLEPGDVIIKVEGTKIDSSQHLQNVIGLHKPGKTLSIVVVRSGRERTVKVTLGNYDTALSSAKGLAEPDEFGLTLAPVSPRSRQLYKYRSSRGAVVSSVVENSSADRAGIQEGDLVVKVNGKEISSSKEFWRLAKDKDRLLLRIERQGQFLFVPLRK